METATLSMQEEVFMELPVDAAELPEKSSERSLYIRRAIEDRKESQRLANLIGDDYWDLD